MKIKALKVIILIMISVFVLSLSVIPCFAYGAERDSYNTVIADDVLSTSIDWNVAFQLDGTSYYDDHLSTAVNFRFNPVLSSSGLSDVSYMYTSDTTESSLYMPNAGYDETLRFSLTTVFDYYDTLPGVNVGYEWTFGSYESDFLIVGVQFQAQKFYYTYGPDYESDTGSPFQLTFDGASSVTTIVNYHELGNAVDAYSVTYVDDTYSQSILSPSMFGFSYDDSFSVFIDRVVVIPDYDDIELISGGLDMSYVYVDDYCQFSRASDLNTHVTPPSDAVFADYTSWIGLAVSGFLDFQIFPGFTFGGLLMVIISFSTVMWFLKLFAGG